MSVGGIDPALSEAPRRGLRSLEEQVRELNAPPFGDGSYYLGNASMSDADFADFLAQHYADRREGVA